MMSPQIGQVPPTLIYAPRARNGLAEINPWLTQPGPETRRRLAAIWTAIERLREHPCHCPVGRHRGVHELPCAGGYRALYRVHPDTGRDETAGDMLMLFVFGPGQSRDRFRPLPVSRRCALRGAVAVAQNARLGGLHDDQGNEISEHDGSGNVLRWMVYDGLHIAPVAMISSSGAVTYNYFDRAGSVMTIADASGAVLSRYAYLPYGDSNPPNISAGVTHPASSGAGTGFGYAGYRYDAETGLYHAGARYYDPRVGRFIQPDPIGLLPTQGIKPTARSSHIANT